MINRPTGKLDRLRAEATVTVLELRDLAAELAGALEPFVQSSVKSSLAYERGIVRSKVTIEDWQRARAALDAVGELERDWAS